MSNTQNVDTTTPVQDKMTVSERNRKKRMRKRPWAQKAESERKSFVQKKTEKPKPVAKVSDDQEQDDEQNHESDHELDHESDEERDEIFPSMKDFVRFTHKGSICHGQVEVFVDPSTDKFYQKNGGQKEDPPFYNVKVGHKEHVSINKSDFCPDSGCNVKICRAVKYLHNDEVVKITYVWDDRSRFVLANQRMVEFADEGKKWVLV